MTALRKGKLIDIRQPSFEELKFVAALWADFDTMKEVGGPIVFERERWEAWYERMVEPGDGRNFYCLIFNKSNKPVGEVSFHRYDRASGTAELNVKVMYKHRGKGYGKEAVMLLLDYYFNEFGGEVITDAIDINNIGGQKVLLNLGFDHVLSDEKAFLVKMTKEKYNNSME
jgi:RimJ/RimL family protein N-acetyltransferase